MPFTDYENRGIQKYLPISKAHIYIALILKSHEHQSKE